jgi:hypothetical protein
MNRQTIIDRLGLPGIAGAVLLLSCLIFYATMTAPARAEVEALHGERDRLGGTLAQAGQRRAATPAAPQLPAFAQAPEVLKQLNAVAQKDGVTVTRSSYQVKAEDAKRVFEVDLPLKLAYPMLRVYLRDVLAMAPAAQLEDLNLHRSQATDPAIDADVRLSFSFAAAS